MASFQGYQLRTTDVAGAREFYRAVFGPGFWTTGVSVVELPAIAAARGAPPHWLGQIGPVDPPRVGQTLAEAGAQPLGGQPQLPIFRDPFGAMLALTPEPPDAGKRPVRWHFHASRDGEAAFTWYGDAFGWIPGDLVPGAAPELGYRLFQTERGSAPNGSFASLARLPHVHPQWLFFFPVESLTAAIARVGAAGGVALEPARAPNGDWMAAGDDRQGAAFGVVEPAR